MMHCLLNYISSAYLWSYDWILILELIWFDNSLTHSLTHSLWVFCVVFMFPNVPPPKKKNFNRGVGGCDSDQSEFFSDFWIFLTWQNTLLPRSFVCSFVRSFARSFVHSIIHSIASHSSTHKLESRYYCFLSLLFIHIIGEQETLFCKDTNSRVAFDYRNTDWLWLNNLWLTSCNYSFKTMNVSHY